MIQEKQIFEDYLTQLNLPEIPRLMGQFEHYHKLLVAHNRDVNLVSRKMHPDNYWVQHFLDSLLAVECVDFIDQTVLDFGSGGGLPGIPIKLVVPDCEMVLLDSINKKTKAMIEMVQAMSLPRTSVECSRLEDYAFMPRRPSFDLILCRAVVLQERYYSPIRRLLKPSGYLVMYKSRNMDDLKGLKYEEIFSRTDDILGKRRLVRIAQRDLMKR
ncbi:MAG: 16S rRNA (guanine(527)-N(7))-methyltransferase RsmG [Candidatus Cloacimonadaceae bacterium]|jgi:16S rRNA (guanine527-N7)-methyltransferase|nr:16S rRNA (guanine(527)-N(7))-methyltransferase RsmG [Candidatus Cloacimonadota bacterium]MDY0127989.1 16S rRNA (guanine(527)-N(7))-methyltransferase RsmG [Candidatus Cloacimonadaceae bacterium]MCB5255347.1 16S rRNA (guanine(527)-N(7))-methyltransferase RsmG [Candidatus Cloacimonadota bacterium]MCK9178234.1 16S rRNA (guanine(527)-N(7))-methyltransferase RsmG [Candidatus Cloacimonadota bacterium]MCK9242228.1 16S rRNA (guanine(527)-N(7))-methyltransferase RsmG [Candidatus Cloacimonadota bacteri